MGKSTVYFTDFRCPVGTSQLDKLKKLCIAAGIKDIDMDGKFVAIKMHFGELGNMAFLRPNYAKVIADLCKEQGGMPFLTDCNTLYPGSRKNALEHLDCANLNGFNTTTTGCQIIIGDGLRGTDEVEVPVVNGEYCKTALIGHAIMDADIFISLSHFKGHETTGFGGAIKNIGMGCGSRAGKMKQHASGKPAINEDLCRGCRRCAKECGSDAITYQDKKAVIDYDKCKGCGRCIGACNYDAVYNPNSNANELLDRKRNILIRELMSLVDKAGELRGSIEDTYKEAYSALQLANISMGLVTPYANCIPVETGVEISTRSVMGVELPKVTLKERPLKVTYGFSQTDSQLDRAYLAFEKVKQTTAVLAEVENSIYRLSVAIKKTQRRANALQNIIIPRNEHIVITDSLEEKDREEFSRMKVIKAAKLKSAK